MSRGPRMRKVNELLREAIAEELVRLKDPRIGFVTITAVDTSPDLRNATVFFSSMGTPEEQEECAEALQHAAPRLQQLIGPQVRLKYLPRLHFERDEALIRGQRIEELLHKESHDHE